MSHEQRIHLQNNGIVKQCLPKLFIIHYSLFTRAWSCSEALSEALVRGILSGLGFDKGR